MIEEIQKKTAPRMELLEKCPICSSKNTKHYFTTIDRLHSTPGEFSYHICNSCKTVFQNPMVIQEDLHLCYPSEYTPYNYDPETPEVDFGANGESAINSRNLIRQAVVKEVWGEPLNGLAGLAGKIIAKSRTARERAFYGLVLDECLPQSRGKNFALDVGCGAGWMLKRLKTVGWNVEGVEWDKKTAEIAAERAGVKVWAGDFREIDLPKGKYQLIFLSHVFEHFNDPVDALKRFYELLSSKGKLVLIYPNPQSLDSRWFAKDWYPWEVPRHLILPSPEAVKILAQKIGFINSSVYTIITKYYWNSSKAYQMGLHPEKSQPKLDFREKLGFVWQQLLVKSGIDKGSEIIVILEKT